MDTLTDYSYMLRGAFGRTAVYRFAVGDSDAGPGWRGYASRDGMDHAAWFAREHGAAFGVVVEAWY